MTKEKRISCEKETCQSTIWNSIINQEWGWI